MRIPMAAPIVAAVEDLFFLSKIRETAQQIGVAVEILPPAKLEERLAQSPAEAIILDLNCRTTPPVEMLRALKGDPATRGIPVIGFVSHVQGDLIAAVRAAGCDTVLARSAFSRELPGLLRDLAGKAAASGPGGAAR